ncbi:Bug family tripartite tricarboxylate transporter substrate binding protein [Actinopolymorpha alba]|uniref:Bug family tripartite tricarboxylate transporter substrate binding protein n=1 Tax=Actinopolymorpha alba TaxID=533267 RepID=UPI00036A237C|nr:tripartite tricarboxylate transporter substrate binding protein [Actinopolymorpha alba]
MQVHPRRRFIALTAAVLASVTACGQNDGGDSGQDASEYPSENLDWTVAFGPGGGNDIMARTIVDILEKEKLYPKNIAVQNREGGSGATGWGYLFKKKGDPYVISTTSGSFITTPLESDTGWTYKDFTTVGLFAADAALFVVTKKSGIASWQEWVAHAKKKGTVAVGGIGTVNVDFILHDLLSTKAGYKTDYVPFDEEGQLLTALTSGALEALVSNPGEVMGQVESGDMVPLLFTGRESLSKLPDVPTGESLGYTDLPTMPRGLILPPGVSREVRDWWIKTMRKVVQTKRWQDYLVANDLVEDLRWGDDFTTFLDETSEEFERILKERGAI